MVDFYNCKIMTDHGDHFSVEVGETNLDSLLTALREHGRRVLICDHGTPVAELTALRRPGRLASIDPSLKAVMLVEGHELTTEEDWPESFR